MKIEVKKIKLGPGSQETVQFVADVYADGIHIGTAENNGHGGETNVRPLYVRDNAAKQAMIDVKFKEAAKYCKSLPSSEYKGVTIPQDIESVVDEQVYDYSNNKEKEKAMKKIKRAFLTKVVVADRDLWTKYQKGELLSFPYYEYAYKVPIASIPADKMRESVARITAKLQPNQIIINDNLPK